MRIEFNVGVYQTKQESTERWTALTLARHHIQVSGAGGAKLREQLVTQLRELLRRVDPRDQELFQLPLASELVRVPIEMKLEGTRLHGSVPLIVEHRATGGDREICVAYHPLRRDEWFTADEPTSVALLAPAFFRHHWKELDGEDALELLSNGKDRLIRIAFSAEPRSLLDQLPSRKADTRARASGPSIGRVLDRLAIDETRRTAAEGTSSHVTVVPRSPYRERLAYLLGGARPRSVAVIGPPGSGKTSLIRQWISDRLIEDGYSLHKNLDRVFHIWRLSGKRLIAGMSYLGQWEERCLSVLHQTRAERGILWIEDLHLFGRLGQSRDSERSFADFFRGPVRRGDLSVIAELTPEQHARLERDAPGLAEALALVAVPAAAASETAQLLLHEVRALEQRLPVALHPFVARTALELGAALFPWRARPGVAIEIVRRVAEQAARAGRTTRDDAEADKPGEAATITLTPANVLDFLARSTGLAPALISLDAPLDVATVEAAFARRVIGQPSATRAAADVILKVRSGLADPHRPIHVMLFTGPTGTGKTELATAIAEYLYGTADRLLRIDMGELSGSDAVARLIGDHWNPEGLLTSRVRAQPFCVVLLDEIEKAHPQALHLLLQLFDEGRLTDAAGDVASFASAVVIMTSNLGARNASPIGFGETRDRALADIARAVREFFPVELFNRIDQVVAFEPLTEEVAAKVVDKELAKLLARRGLRERNTFVYAGAAIRRRAVADAFDPRYGARTVKRWLEDRVAGTLTDLLATAPPARLRIVRITEDAGQMVASLEPMQERASHPGPYALEGALELAASALDHGPDAPVALAAAALGRARAALARVAAVHAAQGELRYYAEELEQRLDALEQLFEASPRKPTASAALRKRPRVTAGYGDGDDDVIYEDFPPEAWGVRRRSRVVRAPVSASKSLPARDELIAGVAEALRIERALGELYDPDAHAVTVMISRVGTTADAHGLQLVVRALAQPEWLDEIAWIGGDGAVIAPPRPPAPESAADPRLGAARDVAITLRGLFVRDALAGEHGMWMIRATAAEPDVVRVELRPASSEPIETVLRAHIAGRAALDHALEHGGPLPPNPDALLPVTRTLAYREPLRAGEPFDVEIEDFSTGWVHRGPVREVAIAIRRAWQLAWSRTAQRAGGAA